MVVGKYLVIIGLIGIAILVIFYIITNVLYVVLEDKMAKIGNVYVNIGDKKNPFNENIRYAEIIDKEYDDYGDLWIKYDYFVKKDGNKVYDTLQYHDRYKDFLVNHELEKINKE